MDDLVGGVFVLPRWLAPWRVRREAPSTVVERPQPIPKCVNCPIGWWAYHPLHDVYLCQSCGYVVSVKALYWEKR